MNGVGKGLQADFSPDSRATRLSVGRGPPALTGRFVVREPQSPDHTVARKGTAMGACLWAPVVSMVRRPEGVAGSPLFRRP